MLGVGAYRVGALSLGTPTVTGGAVAVTGRSVTVGLGTPTVAVSSTVVNPTGQQASVSLGSITFVLGADLHLRVGSTAVITAPGFVGGQVVQPTGQSVTTALGSPTASVINGSVPTGLSMILTASGAGSDLDAAVGVDGFGLTASVGTASAAGVTGNNAVFPVGFGLTTSLGTPAFPADAFVYPIANGTNGPPGISLSTLFAQNAPYWYLGGPVWGYTPTPVVVVVNTQSPTGQSVTASVGTPTVNIASEDTDATVPTTGTELTVGLGTVALEVAPTPAGFGLTLGYGTAVVVVTDSEAPTGYGLTVGLGTPQVIADYSQTVTGYGLTASLGTATVGGNFTVRPTGFRLVASLGSPTLGGTDLNRPLVIVDRSGPRYGVQWAAGPRYELETRSHPRYWALEVRMATNDKVYFNNDDEPEYYITRRNTATGEVEPATGLGSVVCYLSALPMPNHTAIHANLSITLAERSGNPGYYYGVMQGSDLATHLATYANKAVYRILDIGSDVEGQERVTVLAKRPIA